MFVAAVKYGVMLWCDVASRSSMLTSCSRQLHQTVAELLQWSDKILLDGDSAVVDTQQASDVIGAVKRAVNVGSTHTILAASLLTGHQS